MKLSEADKLLEQPYLPLESGWIRLEDGQIHVAARTHMIGCTGKMIDWWFGFIHHTEQYLWWHPRDHVFSDWEGERGTGKYIGGSHLVHEYIGGEMHKLRINFRDPANYFDVSKFRSAGVSTAVCGRVGDLEKSTWFGHLIHLIQELPEGCVMRSRFWLGDFDPAPGPLDAARRRELVPDSLGRGLHQHASEEMSILGGFLPQLYRMYHPRG